MWLSVKVLALAGAVATPRLGVLDFTANNVPPPMAAAVSGVAASELHRLDVFHVSSAEVTSALISHERQRQLLGMSCESGCAELSLGDHLNFDYIVTGRVTKASGTSGKASFTVELSLIDVRGSRRAGVETLKAGSEAEMLDAVGPGVVRLVGRLLDGLRGSLFVEASEAGASVKVDGVLVGTTPLEKSLPLPAGPHLLALEKDGFVTAQQEVRIGKSSNQEVFIWLVPSPDTIEAYESREGKIRLGAWIASGLAVAGAATFGVMQSRAFELYGSPDEPGTFLFHRSALLGGDEGQRELANALKAEIESSQRLSYVGAGVFGLGTVVATWLWIAGDDPARYRRFKEEEKEEGVALRLLPAPGGLVVVGQFE